MIEIKHRISGAVLFSGDYSTLAEAVKAAFSQGVCLSGASFRRPRATPTDLSGVDFSYQDLENADFSEADLTDARFVGSYLYSAVFDASTLCRTRFEKCAMVRTSFHSARFYDTYLADTNFDGKLLQCASGIVAFGPVGRLSVNHIPDQSNAMCFVVDAPGEPNVKLQGFWGPLSAALKECGDLYSGEQLDAMVSLIQGAAKAVTAFRTRDILGKVEVPA